MGMVMLQVLGLVLKLCVFASSLEVQGSAAPSVSITIAPSPVPETNGTDFQPPLIIPPSPWPSNPSTSPPNLFPPPPAMVQDFVPSVAPVPPPGNSEGPPFTVRAPAPPVSASRSSPPNEQTHAFPPSVVPNPDKAKGPVSSSPLSASAPVSNVPAARGKPESPPPSPPPDVSATPPLAGNPPPIKPILNDPPPKHSVKGKPRPSPSPDVSAAPPLTRNSPPIKPILNEPPPSPPEQNGTPMLSPPPRISRKKAAKPIAVPINRTSHHYAPVSHSPTEAPSGNSPLEHSSNNAPPPSHFSKASHHAKVYMTPPPPTSGSSASASPIPSASPASENQNSPIASPPPASLSGQAKIPALAPKKSPSRPPQRSPKTPVMPPFHALPPPPPHKDCAPLTCTEPLTYGPPESPCVCVLPIQVGLRLTVALYTFFPLVSELAAEIAAGAFMKQSQVRIMGANAAGDSPEKTIVLIDLLPTGEKFDDTTAYLTFRRFWNKQVAIKSSFFGSYDVLYVRYPGLPPSPPLPPSTIGIIASKPYPGSDNNARTVQQPLGVDITRNHKHGPSRSILAIIILSCFVAVTLLCAVAWLFVFRLKHQLDPTPPATVHSLAKSSGIAVSVVGSGPSSPSFSLGSSIAAYTGSAKTFSSSDIEKATDFFNEKRILGEGGFGIVYSGILEDGTKVAMKILKRYDQQGGREFLAEVEMLNRLHHRNLVKLIGICVEDRTRCLVYELIPNGSVESHLHGIDKERSPLDWCARLKIALGAARALAYLHEDSSPRVIHRDFKASNILLEDDFTPKVSDFGLARAALDEGNRHISTRVMGTFGYVAPEYAMTGHLLVKSDVYSYGVVLLELLTGRKPVDMSQPPGQENLVTWARPLLTTPEGLESIIDHSLTPSTSLDNIAKVAAIASMCVQPEVSHRPFMGEVVQALKLVWDETRDLPPTIVDVRNSTTSANLLSPSTVSDYEYGVDVERDFSMSELLGSSVGFGNNQDCESFRRYSSSGPLRTGKMKPLWKKMRRLSGGSVSEHGMMLRLWPGSH